MNLQAMYLRILILSTLLFAVGLNQASAKSYEIPEIKVEVSIDENGQVHITEHLTYTFDGDFSWAQYTLARSGYTGITDIRISENGRSYISKNTDQEGTFSVAKSDEAVRLKWHFNASDEQRTFTISYTLQGALTVGTQWSQFFWNYLSDEREKSTSQLHISIDLPYKVPADSMFGWSRGFNQDINVKQAKGTFSVQATNIDDDSFAKLRAVFPSRIFDRSKVSATDHDFSLAQAEQEELAYQQQQAREKKHQAYMADLWTKLSYLIALLSIAVLYFLYRTFSKAHSTSRFASQETIAAPDNTPPAVVGWLLQNRSVTGGMLMGTVLDLARRGYFTIQEELPEEGSTSDDEPTFAIKRTDQPRQPELKKWEQQLLLFIEDQIDGRHQKLGKLFKENPGEVSKWYNSWTNDFKDYCFDKGWIDLESYKGLYWNIAAQLVLMGFGIAAIIFAGPIGLLGVGTSVVAFVLSFGLIRRTPEGQQAYHRWNNYRKGLKNARSYSISGDKLGRHFIYGVAFGLEGEQIEHIITNPDGEIPAFMWITLSPNTSSATAIASSFSTLSATGTATFGATGAAGAAGASASAAGGGASASAG